LSYPLALTAHARGLKIGMVGEIVLPGTSLHGKSAFIEEISGPGGEILLCHDAGASWLCELPPAYAGGFSLHSNLWSLHERSLSVPGRRRL
jgi:hypothetical protein